mmetsp:Transcript_13795/g.27557  ORF Transcript_13795/g.27557 Transcript_13795/m.27557 type:complete len:215 (-) Transcript_13795:397-1041(-)
MEFTLVHLHIHDSIISVSGHHTNRHGKCVRNGRFGSFLVFFSCLHSCIALVGIKCQCRLVRVGDDLHQQRAPGLALLLTVFTARACVHRLGTGRHHIAFRRIGLRILFFLALVRIVIEWFFDVGHGIGAGLIERDVSIILRVEPMKFIIPHFVCKISEHRHPFKFVDSLPNLHELALEHLMVLHDEAIHCGEQIPKPHEEKQYRQKLLEKLLCK